MGPILTVILSLLVFEFLIFIHEFGHYITARIFGVTITEFSLGFGPELPFLCFRELFGGHPAAELLAGAPSEKHTEKE